MKYRRYLAVALLTAIVALLLHLLLPQPGSSSNNPQRQPTKKNDAATNVLFRETFISATPKPAPPANPAATNNPAISAANPPTPSAEIFTNVNSVDTNQPTAPTLSGQPVKPPFEPPAPNLPPTETGMTGTPVVPPDQGRGFSGP